MTGETAKPGNRHLRRAIKSVAVIGAFFVTLWAVLQLDPTRRFVIDSGLAAAESDNFKLTYERVGGNWPWSIRIQNINIQDQKGTWLSAGEATLEWSPFALVRGAVTASRLHLDHVHMTRTPISEPTEPSDPHILPPLPSLPVSITVSRVEATNVTVDKAVHWNPGGRKSGWETSLAGQHTSIAGKSLGRRRPGASRQPENQNRYGQQCA